MIRRPPRSTRTDTLFPYTDALPIFTGGSSLTISAPISPSNCPQKGNCSAIRSEEHTSELQSLMRISYAVFCLKKKKHIQINHKQIRTNNQQNYNHTIT